MTEIMSEGTAENKYCKDCQSKDIARSVIAEYLGNGNWKYAPKDCTVDLAALFRDPEISSGRKIDVVLDLQEVGGRLRNKTNCWMKKFVDSLDNLPIGITVVIDNGVRCPCSTKRGFNEYLKRAKNCFEHTVNWLSSLPTNNNTLPPVILCDKDLSKAMAHIGKLFHMDGKRWSFRDPFVDSVGSKAIFIGSPALILAHPIVVQRNPNRYMKAVADAIPKICELMEKGHDLQK